MHAPLSIRDYRPGDEEGVLRVLAKVLEDYDLTVDPEGTDADLIDIQASYIERGGVFKVLVSGDDIVGSYGLYPEGEGVFELRKMYLLADYQGRGWGRRMLEEAVALAQSKGAKMLTLETNRKLQRAAYLYEQYRFVDYYPDHLSCRCDRAMRLML